MSPGSVATKQKTKRYSPAIPGCKVLLYVHWEGLCPKRPERVFFPNPRQGISCSSLLETIQIFSGQRSLICITRTSECKGSMVPWIETNGLTEDDRLDGMARWDGGGAGRWMEYIGPRDPGGDGLGLLTCQLVSGRPEICIRNMVRRGRGAVGRSGGPGKASLRRGPRANCTVRRSPLKSLPSAVVLVRPS